MAEGKKSFIAYSDWQGTFKALPDEIAGQLIKYIFSYVNDEDPQPHENFVVNALFEQVKATLKRDLDKWEKKKDGFSKAGIESGKSRSLNGKDQVYVVRLYSDTESFIKIGITSTNVSKRFSQGKKGISKAGYKYDIIRQFYEHEIINGDVLKLEDFFHNSFNSSKYEPKNKFSGYTECFKEDVLNKIEQTFNSFNEKQRKATVSVNVNDNVNVNNTIITKEAKAINNDLYLIQASKDTIWLDTTIMQHKLVNIDTALKYLKLFRIHLVSSKEQKDSLKDFCTHFKNWIRKQKIEKVEKPKGKVRYV